MRTMMRKDLHLGLGDKLGDGLRRESVPCLNRGFARHLAERAFDHVSQIRRFRALLEKDAQRGLEDLRRRGFGEDRGIAVNDDARTAQRLDQDAESNL